MGDDPLRFYIDDEDRHVHLHIHFDNPLVLRLAAPETARPTRAVILIQEKEPPMPAEISVDSTTSTVVLNFLDDKGDATSAPAGVAVTYSSDTPSVLEVANDTANPINGVLTGVSAGQATISANLANADGSPLMEPDGSTPFPQPAGVLVTVDPGMAVSATETVNP